MRGHRDWQHPVHFANGIRYWADANGNIRMHDSVPTSDTAGGILLGGLGPNCAVCDTAAKITAACEDADIGLVYILEGTYEFSTTINPTAYTRVVGIGDVTLEWTGGADELFEFTAAQAGCILENLYLLDTGTGSYGVRMYSITGSYDNWCLVCRNVTADGFTYGFHNTTYPMLMEECCAKNASYGISGNMQYSLIRGYRADAVGYGINLLNAFETRVTNFHITTVNSNGVGIYSLHNADLTGSDRNNVYEHGRIYNARWGIQLGGTSATRYDAGTTLHDIDIIDEGVANCDYGLTIADRTIRLNIDGLRMRGSAYMDSDAILVSGTNEVHIENISNCVLPATGQSINAASANITIDRLVNNDLSSGVTGWGTATITEVANNIGFCGRASIAVGDTPYVIPDGTPRRIFVDASGGSVAITLPTNVSGVEVDVIRTDTTSTNDVTVSGASTSFLLGIYTKMRLLGDGTNWYMTAEPILTGT